MDDEAERARVDKEIASLIGSHIELDDELRAEIANILGNKNLKKVSTACSLICSQLIHAASQHIRSSPT
jgi:hypothetical protein